jgi:ElaB/YqjD/DUF883 family membrane-anchored ribosome-binding protein
MADLRDRAKDAVEEGTSNAKKVAEVVADKAAEAVSHVRTWAEPMLDQTHEGYRQLAEQAQDGLRHASKVVRGNPMPSVAAVFGVGIALGVVIGISAWSRRY